MRNKDNRCFGYALISMKWESSPQRSSLFRTLTIAFLLTRNEISAIHKFELNSVVFSAEIQAGETDAAMKLFCRNRPDNLHYRTVDFRIKSLESRLVNVGFDNSKLQALGLSRVISLSALRNESRALSVWCALVVRWWIQVSNEMTSRLCLMLPTQWAKLSQLSLTKNPSWFRRWSNCSLRSTIHLFSKP